MEHVITKKENHVLYVTLNRSDVHNAFNAKMISELTDVFRATRGDNDLRAVLVSGAGKSFCAGADLNYMQSMLQFSKEQNQEDALRLFSMFESVAECPVPVLAKVHGSVMGGGLGIVAACDIVAAESTTKFCFSEAKLGLAPATISPFVLRKVSEAKARELFLTADLFTAPKAHEVGLATMVGSEGEVEQYVQTKLQQIVDNGPHAVRATKDLFRMVREHNWEEVRLKTAQVIAERRVSLEGQEGLKSFFEKRKPSWRN